MQNLTELNELYELIVKHYNFNHGISEVIDTDKFQDSIKSVINELSPEDATHINKLLLESLEESVKDKIDKYGALDNEITELQLKLSKLKKESDTLESELKPLIDVGDDLKTKFMEGNKYIIKIVQSGYSARSVKYKEAFELALTKVNSAIKQILNDAMEATVSIKTVPSKIKVVAKENITEGLFDNIADIIRSTLTKIKQAFGIIDSGTNILKRLANER